MNPVELIIKKRDGQELTSQEMSRFIEDYIASRIDSSQMAAMLMAIYFSGMSVSETMQLTKTYINSGSRIAFPADMHTVDKHSTGGVGDKISLMLAPIVAACGGYVPMISGRGLGHTGGTLDKLESIPGFRTDYSQKQFEQFVNKSGLAIISQSSKLVPADRLIYALRDITGTVESLPLITASIMSKKIAEGAQNLVIDLKVGAGAFMRDIAKARELGKLLKSTGEGFGQKVNVIYTNMNSPLGNYCGNALEVREAIEYLQGEAAPDVDTLTRALAAEMLVLSDKFDNIAAAESKIDEVLSSGAALDKFAEMIEQQGGNPKVIDDLSLLEKSKHKIAMVAKKSGYISEIDSRQIGYALVSIGAGRKTIKDTLDISAGAMLPMKTGDHVNENDFMGYIYCNDLNKGSAALERILAAYKISDKKVEKEDIIIARESD